MKCVFQSLFVLLLLCISCSEGRLYGYKFDYNFSKSGVRNEFWDLPKQVNLYAPGNSKDYIFYFSSDRHTPLQYPCGESCRITLQRIHVRKNSIMTRASIQIFAPPPVAYGILQLCSAPKNAFWERPFIKFRGISCTLWKDSSYNPRPGYLIEPNIFTMEELSKLEIHTWYMTAENYKHMRVNNITNVIVPVFKKMYSLPIFTALYRRKGNPECYFKGPLGSKQKMKRIGTVRVRLVYKYTKHIEAIEKNSGVYTVTCTTLKRDEYASREWTEELSKSLNITFIKVPKIFITGHSDNTILLPSENTFNVSIYSTSPVSTFKVERTDGLSDQRGNIIVSQIGTTNPFSIVYEYRVKIAGVANGMRGTFTMTAVNDKRDSVSRNVQIIKPKDLQVNVRPDLVIAAEGDKVTVDCVVDGDMIISTKWSRDFEKLTASESIRTEALKPTESVPTKGLRLIFQSVSMGDSGRYICTVVDHFKTLQATVDIAVWPQGSPQIMDSHYHSVLAPHQDNSHTLNMSKEELKMDWLVHHPKGLSTSSLILAAATFLVGGIIMLLCVLATMYYLYQLLSASDENITHKRSSTSEAKAKEQSHEELWLQVSRESVQMDKVLSQPEVDTYLGEGMNVPLLVEIDDESGPGSKHKSKKSKKSRDRDKQKEKDTKHKEAKSEGPKNERGRKRRDVERGKQTKDEGDRGRDKRSRQDKVENKAKGKDGKRGDSGKNDKSKNVRESKRGESKSPKRDKKKDSSSKKQK